MTVCVSVMHNENITNETCWQYKHLYLRARENFWGQKKMSQLGWLTQLRLSLTFAKISSSNNIH